MIRPPSIQREVISYYEKKTLAILRRYGPGPRVHFHTGFVVGASPKAGLPIDTLKRALVVAQELMLHHAADIWNAPSTLAGDVLDVGCGLGGGSIFWTQEFGAHVTAITSAPSHVPWVKKFAAQAGVASRVDARLCDALAVPGEGCFDAAVAIDSSCHLARREWFGRLFSLLRSGGNVFIADCFLGRSDCREQFDRYWHTQIGTITEYVTAAEQAGFKPELVYDISHNAQQFWAGTLALIEAEYREKSMTPSENARRASSAQAHTRMRQGLADGGLRYALLSFSKR